MKLEKGKYYIITDAISGESAKVRYVGSGIVEIQEGGEIIETIILKDDIIEPI